MQSLAALSHTSVLNFNIRREKGSETIDENFHPLKKTVGVTWRAHVGLILKQRDLRGEHNGNCVVHDTFSKQQSVEIPICMELIKDGQDRHCTQKVQIQNTSRYRHPPARKLTDSPIHTWVCSRDDGTKEKTVGVVELVS